ncbi:MAG: hypothetical protein ABSF59_13820, partial [Candidatus Sulfotelmatobacter sp.]
KSVLRNKSIGTKVSEDEFGQLEKLAEGRGLTRTNSKKPESNRARCKDIWRVEPKNKAEKNISTCWTNRVWRARGR